MNTIIDAAAAATPLVRYRSVAGLRRRGFGHVHISGWQAIAQADIDAFARASCDHAWMRVDAERCRRDSPYGCTIAHGLLTPGRSRCTAPPR